MSTIKIKSSNSKAASKITKDTYIRWYEDMLLMRRFEEKAGQMYGEQKIRGFCHLYIGQEAVAAGMESAIRPDDIVITAYRDHALALARGISPKECMAELYGKVTGCTKGKGGSMHFFSKERNFYGGHGIVGAQIPLGAGIAFAEKYRKSSKICLCFFGDGAAWQGALHESFNIAALWELPVLYICENNQYAMGTAVERSTVVTDIYKLGEVFGIPSKSVDAMDVENVHIEIQKAAEKVRKTGKPVFLEVKTYRYKGHSMSDPAKYRSKEELQSYKDQDPIQMLLKKLQRNKLATDKQIKAIDDKVKIQVEEAVEFAEESPYPPDSDLYTDIYMDDYPYITD